MMDRSSEEQDRSRPVGDGSSVPVPEDEDADLVSALQSRSRAISEAAGFQLLEKYGPLLRSAIHAWLRGLSWDLGDDLVLATLRKAMTNVTRFEPSRGRHGFRNWLWTIALNLSRDYLKSRQHRQRTTQQSGGPDDSLDDYPASASELPEPEEWAKERAAVDRAIAKLTGRTREYAELFLKFPGEDERAFIAQCMKITMTNERQIRSRMLRELRESLREDGFDVPGGQQ